MDRKYQYLTPNYFIKRVIIIYAVIFSFLLFTNIIIFRNVLLAAPRISRNEASIAREELVPFFNFRTQYLGENLSELTDTDEFRTTYAFWTSWVRYNSILPYSIVLLNTISVFILFYAFYRIARQFQISNANYLIYTSLLSAFLIYLILLYAKIAHFYTLIFGFSLFALSCSLLLENLFFVKKFNSKLLIITSILVLINPAVHFHVIFYLFAVVVLLFTGLLKLVIWDKDNSISFSKNILYVILLILCSAIPYALFIQFSTRGASSVFQSTPVNYWMIAYSSIPIQYLFTLDTLGHVDLYRHGSYLSPMPRIFTAIAYAPALSIFFTKPWRALDVIRKNLLIVILILLAVAIWMSIGYSGEGLFSFHNLLSRIAELLTHYQNILANYSTKLLGIFINILRFPHRFEFILYYTVGVLIAIGSYWAVVQYRKFSPNINFIILSFIMLLPFGANSDYRQTYMSGDFGGFLTPYEIPKDLTNIKNILSKNSDKNRIFILPSLESSRNIKGKTKDYSFLDKYFIYYLDQPSIYYGAGADPVNKILSNAIYTSISRNASWWDGILIDNLGVTNILVPKNLKTKANTVTYYPGIEKKIESSLAQTKSFKKTYSGNDYDLYQTTRKPVGSSRILMDVSWGNLIKYFNNSPKGNSAFLFPIQLNKLVNGMQPNSIYTDSPEKSFYTLYSIKKSKTLSPDTSLLPFTSDLVASSNFTANAFSINVLNNKYDRYNYTKETVRSLLNIPTSQFIGIVPTGATDVMFKDTITVSNNYRLLIHAASKSDKITTSINSKSVIFERVDKMNESGDTVDFTYYKTDLALEKGNVNIRVKSDTNSILVESMTMIQKNYIPFDFNHIDQDGIYTEPTSTKNLFKLKLTI